MFEATTNHTAHKAMKRAHAERSEALVQGWRWLVRSARR